MRIRFAHLNRGPVIRTINAGLDNHTALNAQRLLHLPVGGKRCRRRGIASVCDLNGRRVKNMKMTITRPCRQGMFWLCCHRQGRRTKIWFAQDFSLSNDCLFHSPLQPIALRPEFKPEPARASERPAKGGFSAKVKILPSINFLLTPMVYTAFCTGEESVMVSPFSLVRRLPHASHIPLGISRQHGHYIENERRGLPRPKAGLHIGSA